MPWDPTLYSAFAQPRLRPALDLMARIHADTPHQVVDLGCGTGNVTVASNQRSARMRVTLPVPQPKSTT
jgi:trans-aconitate 2-methyltransferase